VNDQPSHDECERLNTLIGDWSAANRPDSSSFTRLLNALRALCRGRLSRQEINDAAEALERVRTEMAKHPDREPLALTDFFLLSAWTAAEQDQKEAAIATLDCTQYLLRAMRDPVLEWFQSMVKGRVKGHHISTQP
jgi:hypothetical protein